MLKIVDAQGKNYTSSTYDLDVNEVVITANGTFDGEDVTLYLVDPAGGADIAIQTFTEPGARIMRSKRGHQIKAITSNGAGNPTITLAMDFRL